MGAFTFASRVFSTGQFLTCLELPLLLLHHWGRSGPFTNSQNDISNVKNKTATCTFSGFVMSCSHDEEKQ